MSISALNLEQLGVDLDRSGFAGRESAIGQVVRLARTYGAGGPAVGVLGDPTAPDVARMRAFGVVAGALLGVSTDRPATPLADVA